MIDVRRSPPWVILCAACARPDPVPARPVDVVPPAPAVETAPPPVGPQSNSDGSPRVLPASPDDEPDFTLVLRYEDFGPPAAASKLLGPEWYTWSNACCFEPGDRFDVRVVVFAGLPRDEVTRRYPTEQGRADHRYVALDAALRYLAAEERSLAQIDPAEDPVLVEVRAHLLRTRARIVSALGEAEAPAPDAKRLEGGKPPSVTMSSTVMVGPKYPPEIFQRVMLAHRDRLQRCASRHADLPPSEPAGMQFTVDSTGRVTSAKLVRGEVTVRPDARQDCWLRVLRGLKFVGPDTGTITVTYPIQSGE